MRRLGCALGSGGPQAADLIEQQDSSTLRAPLRQCYQHIELATAAAIKRSRLTVTVTLREKSMIESESFLDRHLLIRLTSFATEWQPSEAALSRGMSLSH